jgi:hypothetical protein
VVTAIMVIGVMLGLGLGTYAFVTGQQRQSGVERVRESSFNLGEGTLASQAFLLSSASWPGSSQTAFVSSCGPASTNSRCPDQATIESSFDQSDYADEPAWTTQVRDDGDAPPAGTACNTDLPDPFYSDAVTTNPTYDANCNGEVWVRSDADVQGEPRAIVAKVKVEQVDEEFPENVLTAGKFGTGNNGNKVIVDRQGAEAAPAPIAVRCAETTPGCTTYRNGQVSPAGITYNWPGQTFGEPYAIDRLRAKAQSYGSAAYFASGCPPTLDSPYRIVFIEQTPPGGCTYSGNTVWNSASKPGLLVVANGTLNIGGVFYGLIYMANGLPDGTPSSDFVLNFTGNVTVQGAVAVDGPGGVQVGQDKVNLVFDDQIFRDPFPLASFGSAGIIQNTFRELPVAPD